MTESETTEADVESGDGYIYICTGKFARSKSVSPSGEQERYGPADEIEPTERELELYPNKFLKLDSDGTLAEDVNVERELTPEEKLAKQYRTGR